MKLVFKSNGETASAIKPNEYLKRGNIFDKVETLNPEYVKEDIKGQAVFTLKFKELGFYILQAKILIYPFNLQSINSLHLINNFNDESTLLIKAYNNIESKQNYVINHNDSNYSYSFILKNDLGKCQECRVSDIEVFFYPY